MQLARMRLCLQARAQNCLSSERSFSKQFVFSHVFLGKRALSQAAFPQGFEGQLLKLFIGLEGDLSSHPRGDLRFRRLTKGRVRR